MLKAVTYSQYTEKEPYFTQYMYMTNLMNMEDTRAIMLYITQKKK